MDRHLVLPDGRRLGYGEYGDPKGEPLFFFPGTPHSRLCGPRQEEPLRTRCLRFIVVERPGFGISHYQERRSLLDWPADVTCLADALGINRFFLAGTSGGAPYVAVLGVTMRERVRAAAIVAGFGPLGDARALSNMVWSRRVMAVAFRTWPRSMEAIARRLPARPELVYRVMAGAFTAEDRLAADWAWRMADVREALRPGLRGLAKELSIVTGDWGFRLEEVAVKTHVWHGDADRATPLSMGLMIAERIPDSLLHVVPGAGHLLWQTHQVDILRCLTA